MTTIKEIPLLFQTEMVRAVLEDRKTQTRRIKGLEYVPRINFDEVEYSPTNWPKRPWIFKKKIGTNPDRFEIKAGVKSIYGKPGDLLWVRETHRFCQPYGPESLRYQYKDGTRSDIDIVDHYLINDYDRWRPSIHMPKSACRIWLMVEEITVERLQDISEEDAKAEGVEACLNTYNGGTAYFDYSGKTGAQGFNYDSAKESFQTLWISINGQDSWDANPWVWVVKFRVLSTTGRPTDDIILQHHKSITGITTADLPSSVSGLPSPITK